MENFLKKPASNPKETNEETKPGQQKEHSLVEARNYIFQTYQIRKNTLTLELEVINEETGQSEQATDEFINDLWFDMTVKGYKVSAEAINRIIHNRTHLIKVNPLLDYLQNLQYDGKTDYINQLSETITMADTEGLKEQKNLWPEFLKRWLVASVAGVMSARVNQWCLVLNGGGGKGKSMWCNRLMPQSLNEYLFSGHIIPNNADQNTANLLAEKWLVNLEDQLQGLTGTEYHHMKNIITVPSVTNRKAFHRSQPKRARIASFIASVDDPSFLVGHNNRRWLVFTIDKIKYNHEIEMDNVWGQAVHLFLNGFKYWFTEEENQQLNEMNKIYQVVAMEEELLLQYFKPAAKNDFGAEHIGSGAIFNTLQDKTKRTLNSRAFQNALTQNKFIRVEDWKADLKQGRYGYWVIKLENNTPPVDNKMQD